MRIAAFNVENLFNRPKALNNETWAEGKPILEAYARLSKLFEKEQYSPADKKSILKELGFLGLKKSDESEFVWRRTVTKARASVTLLQFGSSSKFVARRSAWLLR
jgi:hypothetical protein